MFDQYFIEILLGSLVFAISGLGFISLVLFLMYFLQGGK
jgi:hypothetical protein|tara:strand:- start:717 stop:833 length:117 start_codon:yes stop_codon:yes gene_type:complete